MEENEKKSSPKTANQPQFCSIPNWTEMLYYLPIAI